jgi:hypothetical protein
MGSPPNLGKRNRNAEITGTGAQYKRCCRIWTVSTHRREVAYETHAELAANIRGDALSNEERECIGDALDRSRIAAHESSDLGSDDGDLEALGKVNRDRRVQGPGDSDELTPGCLGDDLGGRLDGSSSGIHEGVDPEAETVGFAVEEDEEEALAVLLLNQSRGEGELTRQDGDVEVHGGAVGRRRVRGGVELDGRVELLDGLEIRLELDSIRSERPTTCAVSSTI